MHPKETSSCFEQGTVATIDVESPDSERLHKIQPFLKYDSRFGGGLGTESVSATLKIYWIDLVVCKPIRALK